MGMAKEGLVDKITATFVGLGLPVEIPQDLSREEIIRAMYSDKKREKSVVKFALPVDIGKVQVGVAVGDLEKIFEEKA
jgi:3-dehydroquinate synthetase